MAYVCCDTGSHPNKRKAGCACNGVHDTLLITINLQQDFTAPALAAAASVAGTAVKGNLGSYSSSDHIDLFMLISTVADSAIAPATLAGCNAPCMGIQLTLVLSIDFSKKWQCLQAVYIVPNSDASMQVSY